MSLHGWDATPQVLCLAFLLEQRHEADLAMHALDCFLCVTQTSQ
jgi:hypothetical protein